MNTVSRLNLGRPLKPFIYECVLVVKDAPKEEVATALKRCAQGVFKRGGFLRNLYFLGLQKTPYRFSKNKVPHWSGNFFLYELHMPKALIPDLYNEYTRDVDVIKHTFLPKEEAEIDFENCTFEDEMKPVPYRPQVVELVEKAQAFTRRMTRRRVKLNLTADYYPFQR
ncbi:small ribosomal subunit protein bS6m-like [Planococcus citri]|uniref:small ribosomal subunit protein bS6m-like n=1 Tax=Planococcus citri TaxID=170843 RepID=UPI0031F840AB